jgi:hypothetical protein
MRERLGWRKRHGEITNHTFVSLAITHLGALKFTRKTLPQLRQWFGDRYSYCDPEFCS